jgi:hypothetical protein
MTTPYSASRTAVRHAQPPFDEHTARVLRYARAQRRRRRAQRVLTRA